MLHLPSSADSAGALFLVIVMQKKFVDEVHDKLILQLLPRATLETS
jgi:hypothetical protein